MRPRPILAWLLVTAVAAWAIVRLLGLERGYPLVPLIAYTPMVAAAAVVVVLATAALRQWAATLAGAILALALVILVAPRALGGPSEATGRSGPTLGVLTVNLHRAQASPEAVVALARRTGAHLLSVQEIDAQSAAALDAAGLAALMPERVVRFGSDTSGTALYSRVPLRPRREGSRTHYPTAAAIATRKGAAPLRVTAIHPLAPAAAPLIAGWRDDLRALPEATPDGPVRILAGDFNATLDHAELRRLIETGYEDAADQVGSGLRATWPVGRRLPPPVTIDHVLADERCGVRSVSVHAIPGSDHRALFAELVLPRA